MREYIVSVDIGQRTDPFCVHIYRDFAKIVDGSEVLKTDDRIVHYLDLMYEDQAKGLEYETMADYLATLVRHTAISNNYDMVVDSTGIGSAIVEMLRKRRLNPIPIWYTSSGSVKEIYTPMGQIFSSQHTLGSARALKEIHVPKADLVSSGMVLMQQGRLRITEGVKHIQRITTQLDRFKRFVDERTRRVTYEAESEAVHDEDVVCYLMAAWWMQRSRKDDYLQEQKLQKGEEKEYNPMDYV